MYFAVCVFIMLGGGAGIRTQVYALRRRPVLETGVFTATPRPYIYAPSISYIYIIS